MPLPGLPRAMCYRGTTMAKKAAATARAGRTAKVSISLDEADLRTLRRRAKSLYGGNLSAAIAEAARRIREQEGREAVVEWLGDAGKSTAEEREAIRAEWRAETPKRRRPGAP